MVKLLPCPRKRAGKGCPFGLLAVRPDLESGKIHVYAHSKHNHPIMSEGKSIFLVSALELHPRGRRRLRRGFFGDQIYGDGERGDRGLLFRGRVFRGTGKLFSGYPGMETGNCKFNKKTASHFSIFLKMFSLTEFAFGWKYGKNTSPKNNLLPVE
jgi:hypothetical protein